MQIHSTAIVNSKAELGKNVSIGPYTLVEEDVQIADDCKIASNVILAAGTRLGNKCEVHHGAVLGTVPQDLKFKGEKTRQLFKFKL